MAGWTEKKRGRSSAEVGIPDTHFENHVVGRFGLDLEVGARDRIVLSEQIVGRFAEVFEARWHGLRRHVVAAGQMSSTQISTSGDRTEENATAYISWCGFFSCC
jgi:hypothetical protein